jgi:hypothetical protein
MLALLAAGIIPETSGGCSIIGALCELEASTDASA